MQTYHSLESRIEALRRRHADLESQIQSLQASPSAELEVTALKKSKLRIKDEIARLATH